MFRSILGRLTYANVMATVAVFIAIGGGAYAAGLAKNSVKSRQIKNSAVKAVDLAPAAVTSDKVADGSLLGKDFAAGALLEGERGPVGATGDTGAAGRDGRNGTDGTDGIDGQDGDDGSPDTPAQVLGKLLNVDGDASGLVADQVDGVDAAATGDVMSSRVSVPQGGPTNTFAPIIGIANAATPRTASETGSPNRSVVGRDLFVRLAQSPSGPVQISLTVDGVATGLTCTVNGSTICNSGTGTAAIPAGSLLALQVTEGAGANANGVTATVGFRLAPA
jgi:hypothetical protein